MQGLEEIKENEQLYAIIIRAGHTVSGAEFYTPNNFSQQIAAMGHKKGKVIQPHVHNPVQRHLTQTQEVLIIKKGQLRVDFYREDHSFLQSAVLLAGDIIMLVSGGHGFEVLEDVQMVEVKQGPYAGAQDKTLFTPQIKKAK